ncbi:exported hypothetical protein [Candidatus Magnetomoraceae bacterium gMMP-15]
MTSNQKRTLLICLCLLIFGCAKSTPQVFFISPDSKDKHLYWLTRDLNIYISQAINKIQSQKNKVNIILFDKDNQRLNYRFFQKLDKDEDYYLESFEDDLKEFNPDVKIDLIIYPIITTSRKDPNKVNCTLRGFLNKRNISRRVRDKNIKPEILKNTDYWEEKINKLINKFYPNEEK